MNLVSVTNAKYKNGYNNNLCHIGLLSGIMVTVDRKVNSQLCKNGSITLHFQLFILFRNMTIVSVLNCQILKTLKMH